MMASRAIGYLLLALLVGAVIVSFIILGVQWVRSSNNEAKGTPSPSPKAGQIFYEFGPSVQISYVGLPVLNTEV